MSYDLERLQKLRKTIEVEAAVGRHDQSSWGSIKAWDGDYPSPMSTVVEVSCPTTACAAGWAVINEGAKMVFELANVDTESEDEMEICTNDCVTRDGEARGIEQYAAELLGLSNMERVKLFSGSRSTLGVLRMLDELIVAAKHGRTWAEQREFNQLAKIDGAHA